MTHAVERLTAHVMTTGFDDLWPHVRRLEGVTGIGDEPFYRLDLPQTDDGSPFRDVLQRSRAVSSSMMDKGQ